MQAGVGVQPAWPSSTQLILVLPLADHTEPTWASGFDDQGLSFPFVQQGD